MSPPPQLSDLLSSVLLTYYSEEVSGLACRVIDPGGKAVFEVGSAEALPALSSERLAELAASPVPLSLSGARACALVGRGELVGYAVVSCPSEDRNESADFIFQLLNDQLSMHAMREDLSFDMSYLKNVIAIMQRMMQRTAAVFEAARAAEVFLKECRTLFPVKSGAVLVIEEEQESKRLKPLAFFGEAFNDYQTADYVCFSGRALVCNDTASDPRFSRLDEGGNPVTVPFKNVLVVPLLSGEQIYGVLYLCDKEMGSFWDEDQKMAQTLGVMLGSTISNIQLHEAVVRNERVKSNLERYLSPNLVKEIIAAGGMQQLGGRRVEATMLFSDIRGFTKLSERYSPEQMVTQLNEYFEEMSRIIFAYDGTLDKYVGDLIMVLFGVPKAMTDAPLRAVKAAIEMQARIAALNAKWASEQRGTFGVGIGINTGDVVFGNIGSSHAMGLTVIGDHVNKAQRLEAFAAAGEILISDSVYAAIQSAGLKTIDLGEIESKGKALKAHRVDYIKQ